MQVVGNNTRKEFPTTILTIFSFINSAIEDVEGMRSREFILREGTGHKRCIDGTEDDSGVRATMIATEG